MCASTQPPYRPWPTASKACVRRAAIERAPHFVRIDMSHSELLLTIAGCLHFLQIPSTSHLARRLLKLGPDLAKLTPINARVVRIFVAAASLLILGLGITVIL